MFKLALTAGHYMGTPGRRCLKAYDPEEHREWWLNDRICDKIEKKFADYDGIAILRTDDTTGKTEVGLAARPAKANKWGADFYLSVHHNAGVNGGSGGGIVAYTYTVPSATSVEMQKLLYNALIAATGLKGNRSNPLEKANHQETRDSAMPAVLLELGFMDSKTDIPIIISEDFAEKCANAIVETIAAKWQLKKKQTEPPKEEATPAPAPTEIPNAMRVKLLRVYEELGEILGAKNV